MSSLPSPRGLELAGVTEQERRIIQQAFANPLEIPPIFKGWLEAYLEPIFERFGAAAGITIPSTGYGTTLPVSPTDGERFVLVDSVTAPTWWWELRYNSGSTDASKWEKIDGVPLYAEVASFDAAPAVGAYGAMTNVGPSIVLPHAGDYFVEHGFTIQTSILNNLAVMMSYDIGGTGAVDADAVTAYHHNSGTGMFSSSGGRTRLKTGLAAVTLTAKYKSLNVGGELTGNRWMSVMPKRIQ